MMRLDIFLASNGYAHSRNKASELIKDSKVKVNNILITKPSFICSLEDVITLLNDNQYVSRSANKLKYFLSELNLKLNQYKCLDIGSSTGGFTQILLENSIESIDCVDVGSNQLHYTLRDNKKIKIFENCDIRVFNNNYLYDIIVSDVSFISLHLIINDINRLAKEHIILLFKPQYEVGKNSKRDNNGVLQNIKDIKDSQRDFELECKALGWTLILTRESKVKGKNGNSEFFYYFKK